MQKLGKYIDRGFICASIMKVVSMALLVVAVAISLHNCAAQQDFF